MAKRNDVESEELYAVARQIRERAVERSDSLFTPGAPVWTLDNLEDLRARVIDNPDEGDANFETRLAAQLSGASDRVKQLAGEVLFVYCWIVWPGEMGADRKTVLIESVLNLMQAPIAIPAELRSVLNQGLARTGIAYHAGRYYQFSFILAALSAWKKRTDAERTALLAEPWAFKTFLESVDVKMGGPMRMAMMHMVFPDTFEPIVSKGEKKRIAKAFPQHIPAGVHDVDRQLSAIRSALSPSYGDGFNFWRPELKQIWKAKPDKWDAFIDWAKRMTLPEEREYKLKIAQKMRAAREAVLADAPDWAEKVRAGFGYPNNVLSHFIWLPFMKACEANPERAKAELRSLWDSESPLSSTFMQWEFNPEKVSRAGRTSLAAILLMGVDETRYPPYKRSAFNLASRLVGFLEGGPTATPAEAYGRALELLDEMITQAAQRGLIIKDRLDAQGLLWQIAEGGPNAKWPEAELNALESYRTLGAPSEEQEQEAEEDPPIQEPPQQAPLVKTTSELADELLLSSEFIDEVRGLLEQKRQVIFYGPPGTGKTYLAQQLARYFAGDRERVTLVQFHPSYAYEDFVEGYRPKESGFVLTDGPLKTFAARAVGGQKHVMIIDEINRANPARVLGELYFLLEYRKERIRLQYSQSDFFLPDDLWFIGTMNTADRSIATLDAALRRRFYFVPFFPDEKPFDTMLQRWLERYKPELAWVDAVVREANRLLADRHASIGASHFMRPELTEAWVDRIWRYSVLPYVEERLVGQTERLPEFDLKTLRAVVQTA